LRVECIFNDPELTAMMGDVDWRLDLLVGKVFIPNFSVVLIPIIRKVHALLHVTESAAMRALLHHPIHVK